MMLSLLLALLIFCAFWLSRLFSVPAYYIQPEPISDRQVSRYLSNKLIPELHNKSQYGLPFDYVITQKGVSDIIARHADFEAIRRSGFKDITVVFVPEEILLMSKTRYLHMDLIVTAAIEPGIDSAGRLFLKSGAIKLGRSKIPFASDVAKKRLLQNFDSFFSEANFAEALTAVQSLLNEEHIEPVLRINGNNIRAEKITIDHQKLTIHFVPEGD